MTPELQNLISNGHRLFPCKVGKDAKQPRDHGYHSKTYDTADLQGNVGMLLSPGIVDVDLDWPEAQRLANCFFGSTGIMFGRGSPTRIRHLLFSSELGKGIDYKLPKAEGFNLLGEHGHMVLQLRVGDGDAPHHVMIPPSVHPCGEKLQWHKCASREFGKPIKIAPDTLSDSAGYLAAAAFFLRFYPAKGARDEFAFSLTGAMVRAQKFDDKFIENFITYLARTAGDEEYAKRGSKVTRTRERLERGEPLRGLNSLCDILGVPWEVIREVGVWLGIINSGQGGPVVYDKGVIKDTASQVWARLEEYMVGSDPGVYVFGERLARYDGGRVQILDKSMLRNELNRCARWLRPIISKGTDAPKWKKSNAPLNVVDDMLAARTVQRNQIPNLKGVSAVPIVTRDGRLILKRGYDWDTEYFVDPNVHINVPSNPSREDVQAALENLKEPLADFPFADESDRANALAMMIEPYVRDFFGCAPLYFINKPSAGTGASLLVHVVSYPSLGREPSTSKPPVREEEMEKQLTANLMEAAPLIFFDDAKYLDSKALASALTAERYRGRILGRSEMVDVPIRCMWAATGNNTGTTAELYRRFVDIRLDAQMENPEDRTPTGFKIPDLKGWVKESRSELVSAALTLVVAWARSGMKRGTKSKASYEAWAGVMSGILEHAGVEGFLETPLERRPQDPETEEVRGLVAKWWTLTRASQRGQQFVDSLKEIDGPGALDVKREDWTKPKKAKSIARLIEAAEIDFDIGFNDPARAVGERLKQYKDRIFSFETKKGDGVCIQLKSRPIQNSNSYWLEAVNGDASAVGEVGGDEPLAPMPF